MFSNDKNDGITTVCFMGGDAAPEAVSLLAEYAHEIRKLKVGWYSGMDELSEEDKKNKDKVVNKINVW